MENRDTTATRLSLFIILDKVTVFGVIRHYTLLAFCSYLATSAAGCIPVTIVDIDFTAECLAEPCETVPDDQIVIANNVFLDEYLRDGTVTVKECDGEDGIVHGVVVLCYHAQGYEFYIWDSEGGSHSEICISIEQETRADDAFPIVAGLDSSRKLYRLTPEGDITNIAEGVEEHENTIIAYYESDGYSVTETHVLSESSMRTQRTQWDPCCRCQHTQHLNTERTMLGCSIFLAAMVVLVARRRSAIS